MMKTKVIALIVFLVGSSVSISSGAEAEANAEAKAAAEAKAKADYEAAEKTAKEAEAAIVPLRAAMQKADVAYANARKAANTKRKKATDAKNLAGEQGVKDLKQAQDNVDVAIKTLAEATKAKPPLDKALTAAK